MASRTRRPAVRQEIAAIFLDDGGVMNDNARRALEWRRLVGEFLAPRLGGAAEAWGEANAAVFERPGERFEAWQRERASAADYGNFLGSPVERERWLREMCEHVGIASPEARDCVALAIETERYVIPRVRAAFPGAVEAIRTLHVRGYRLSTASGSASRDLEDNLGGMGVRELFAGRLYGPDLVRTRKLGPDYYPRIFARERMDPALALVVDDSPETLRFAKEAGALAVLVSREAQAGHAADFVIGSLAELPAALRERTA